jgi:hypothetical protein
MCEDTDMTRFEHCGENFDEKTDWLTFLRDAAQGRSTYGLAPDLDVHAGLGELYEALQGTSMQAAMASAALRLLETGDPKEQNMMYAIPFQRAPGAKQRLLKLLEQSRARLDSDDVDTILHRLLEENLGDPDVTAALQRELERPDSKLTDLGLAARHLPDWFIRNLPLLRPPPPVKECSFIAWLIRVPEDKRQMYLDSIAALGEPYVDALIADHLDPRDMEWVRQRDRPVLEAHPVFRQALAEALGKSPA